MLRKAKNDRSLRENLMLASSTAFVSGGINVASIIAFLAFTTNVTGHVAKLAHHVVEQNIRELVLFVVWLLLFFLGAFTANFIIRSLERKSLYRAHTTPVFIEVVLLVLIAIYGDNFYNDSQTEREILIGTLLFTMGLQNSMVSTVSGGLVKTSHLTGLFTDLGGEVSEYFHPNVSGKDVTKNKIYIRLTILTFYITGGVIGGYFFNRYNFAMFYIFPVILLTIIYYDLSPIALHKLERFFWRSKNINA
ncbi:DUF1275 domain-containing protein [Mucilaginibacter sp. RS28]|uniref:DUF1275 domain-containing protein n=1 Tax=Mucilaginibacter straminoryzae TaxID=2932774 RepID=A0A9X1XBK2_9SPHI|nr:YoaK family protein [Mucilaginibacter straminoryzae]MCJ8211714.1 DUF1275 domain-containing protein [Mucilaginibacter straminoryzae]